MPSKRLTRTGFVAWLRSLPLDKPLPQPDATFSACPIGCFAPDVGLAAQDISTYTEKRWAGAFMKKIDAKARWRMHNLTAEGWLTITPRDCLGVLGEKV